MLISLAIKKSGTGYVNTQNICKFIMLIEETSEANERLDQPSRGDDVMIEYLLSPTVTTGWTTFLS